MMPLSKGATMTEPKGQYIEADANIYRRMTIMIEFHQRDRMIQEAATSVAEEQLTEFFDKHFSSEFNNFNFYLTRSSERVMQLAVYQCNVYDPIEKALMIKELREIAKLYTAIGSTFTLIT